jgi:hypothetical protein
MRGLNGSLTTSKGGFAPKNNKTRATLVGVGTSSDEFYTPDYAVEPLLPYLPNDKVIWECAWGTGELAGHLRAAGYHVVGRAGMDFLREQPESWDIAVTNPPYSHKDEFLKRAYSLGNPLIKTTEQGAEKELRYQVVCLLLNLPLVVEARSPHRGGDIAHPIEAPHPFESLPVFGIGCPLENIGQFVLEKPVVLRRGEAEIRLDQPELSEDVQVFQPLEERPHIVSIQSDGDL